MNVVVEEKIKGDSELQPLLEKANSLLEGEASGSRWPVTATWTTARDQPNGQNLVLTLSDQIAEVSERIEPNEFRSSPERFELRLNHLWSALLRTRSETLLKNLENKFHQMED